MKKAEVFFHPMEGSGQLSISWSAAIKGAAVEAKKGNGVGFFAANGDLLSVIFDDVSTPEDHQILEFKNYKVEISIKNEAVKHKVTQLIRPKVKVTKSARKTTRPTRRPGQKNIRRKAGSTIRTAY